MYSEGLFCAKYAQAQLGLYEGSHNQETISSLAGEKQRKNVHNPTY